MWLGLQSKNLGYQLAHGLRNKQKTSVGYLQRATPQGNQAIQPQIWLEAENMGLAAMKPIYNI